MNKRKKTLAKIVRQGSAYCEKYKRKVTLMDYHRAKCYLSTKRNKKCRYFSIMQ
ncbi:MAG: hypothetical protein KAJ49_03340 [Arcobacteraceae bacterium]|nr:hypothetical protein [Arcobacteraceae bacterium]